MYTFCFGLEVDKYFIINFIPFTFIYLHVFTDNSYKYPYVTMIIYEKKNFLVHCCTTPDEIYDIIEVDFNL